MKKKKTKERNCIRKKERNERTEKTKERNEIRKKKE